MKTTHGTRTGRRAGREAPKPERPRARRLASSPQLNVIVGPAVALFSSLFAGKAVALLRPRSYPVGLVLRTHDDASNQPSAMPPQRRRHEQNKGGVTVLPAVLEPHFHAQLPVEFVVSNSSAHRRTLKRVQAFEFDKSGAVGAQVVDALIADVLQAVDLPPNTQVTVTLRFAQGHPDPNRVAPYKAVVVFAFDSFQICRYFARGADGPYVPVRGSRRQFNSARFPARPRQRGNDALSFRLNEVVLDTRPAHPHMLDEVLCFDNFTRKMQALVHLEEKQAIEEMADYDLVNVRPTLIQGLSAWFSVPGLADNRPSLIIGDKALVRKTQRNSDSPVGGVVTAVELNEICLLLFRPIESRALFDVRFIANRFPILMRHAALDEARFVLNRLFPIAPAALAASAPALHDDQLNSEQCLAVAQILNMPPPPARFTPFIVFGPPGTGKTTTLVAATVRLLQNSRSNIKILVTAASNVACDNFAARLSASTAVGVVRLLAKSRMQKGQDLPTLTQLRHARVIVATLSIAGKLKDPLSQDPIEFSHVIVDEAGQSDEPETCIALAFPFARKARWILGGDPRQLGPIIKCALARNPGGLDVSLIERLTRLSWYNVDHAAHRLDHSVRLVRNYRSHQGIIHVPSLLFYGNTLQAMNSRDSLLGWGDLMGARAPLLARHVAGFQDRAQSSPSWFNLDEVVAVVGYVQKLVGDARLNPRVRTEDIIVITPYIGQVKRIQKGLTAMKLNGVRTGTVELFQGQESRIVILSTVRSSLIELEADVHFSLGFITNPKRFNVAVTRAKELLLLVGNLDVLRSDVCWGAFIRHCTEFGRVDVGG